MGSSPDPQAAAANLDAAIDRLVEAVNDAVEAGVDLMPFMQKMMSLQWSSIST